MKNVDFVVANDFADIVDKNARMTVSRRTDLHDFHAKLLKIAPQLILAFAIICDDKIVAILQARNHVQIKRFNAAHVQLGHKKQYIFLLRELLLGCKRRKSLLCRIRHFFLDVVPDRLLSSFQASAIENSRNSPNFIQTRHKNKIFDFVAQVQLLKRRTYSQSKPFQIRRGPFCRSLLCRFFLFRRFCRANPDSPRKKDMESVKMILFARFVRIFSHYLL